jgi:hypothetical protein
MTPGACPGLPGNTIRVEDEQRRPLSEGARDERDWRSPPDSSVDLRVAERLGPDVKVVTLRAAVQPEPARRLRQVATGGGERPRDQPALDGLEVFTERQRTLRRDSAAPIASLSTSSSTSVPPSASARSPARRHAARVLPGLRTPSGAAPSLTVLERAMCGLGSGLGRSKGAPAAESADAHPAPGRLYQGPGAEKQRENGQMNGGAGNRTLRERGRKRTQTDPSGRKRTRIRRLEREDAPVCDRDTTRCDRFGVPSVPSRDPQCGRCDVAVARARCTLAPSRSPEFRALRDPPKRLLEHRHVLRRGREIVPVQLLRGRTPRSTFLVRKHIVFTACTPGGRPVPLPQTGCQRPEWHSANQSHKTGSSRDQVGRVPYRESS